MFNATELCMQTNDKIDLLSRLPLSTDSSSEHIWTFTSQWATMGTAGCASLLTPKEPGRPWTSFLPPTQTKQQPSTERNWILQRRCDSERVRITKWSMSGGQEGGMAAWHHADVQSESRWLAEKSCRLSLFHFPHTGVSMCVWSNNISRSSSDPTLHFCCLCWLSSKPKSFKPKLIFQ